jgi:hypothetical protein
VFSLGVIIIIIAIKIVQPLPLAGSLSSYLHDRVGCAGSAYRKTAGRAGSPKWRGTSVPELNYFFITTWLNRVKVSGSTNYSDRDRVVVIT